MYIPLTGFGNVTLGDSVSLAKALRAEARTWDRPTVHLAGGTALEFPGDESVWAKIDGDLDALNTIGRGVPQVVQRLGFFVDRRAFRPWLPVGTITDTTTAPYLEKRRGARWRPSAAELDHRGDLADEGAARRGPRTPFEEMERMPLAPADVRCCGRSWRPARGRWSLGSRASAAARGSRRSP